MRGRSKEREQRHDGERVRRNGHQLPPRRPSRAVQPRPRRRPRGPVMTQVVRLTGLAATALLLAVGVSVAMMVTRDNETDPPETFAAADPTPAPAAKPKKAKRPRGPRLTNAQRASRTAAVSQLRSQGFEPVTLADYKPRQALRVLIGRPKASTGLRGRRAFFFMREEYLGTDAAEPSRRVRVLRQRDGVITLAYTLNGPPGTARVRFTVADGRLIPEDPIPPFASRQPPS